MYQMYQKIVTTIAWALCAIRDFVFSILSILKKWYRPEWYKWYRSDYAPDIKFYGTDKSNKDNGVYKSNKDSMPDLIFWTFSGDLEQVNQLIKDRVDLNIYWTFNKNTALMYAAGRGYSEIVHALIEAGADVHQTNRFGRTALHYVGYAAIDRADEKLIDITNTLIKAGARDENTQELVAEKETYRQAEEVTTIASGDLVSNSQASLFSRNTTDDGKYPDPEVEISEILYP